MVFGNSKGEVSKMRLRVLFYEFVYDDELKGTLFPLLLPAIALYPNPIADFFFQIGPGGQSTRAG